MDLATILNLITTSAVLIGVVFGLIQLRQYQLGRKREAALLVLNSFQTSDFLTGLWKVLQIPDGLDKAKIEEIVGVDIDALYLVMTTWERVGILVFREELTLDIVDDAFSGPIVISWRKLERYVRDLRVELNRDTILEWFEWLAERMMERESTTPPVPAYIAHKDWEP